MLAFGHVACEEAGYFGRAGDWRCFLLRSEMLWDVCDAVGADVTKKTVVGAVWFTITGMLPVQAEDGATTGI